MAISFTLDQQKAIDLQGKNILVSAAAGSGKTAVLVERIIQMICRKENPVDIDRLLIVTFTHAAASEMREKISQAIEKRIDDERMQRQATLLHNAQITTIDSFCLYVIRNNFNDIGLDPVFRVAQEGEVKLLKQDVMAELIEDHFVAKEESFYSCVEFFCPDGRESVLENHIQSLYDFAMSYPWPEDWLLERKKDYAVHNEAELEELPWAKFLKGHLHKQLLGLATQMRQVQGICEEPDGPYMYGELVEKEAEQIEKLCELTTLVEMSVKIPAMAESFGRLPAKKDESVLPDKRERAQQIRNSVKKLLQGMSTGYFAVPIPTALRQMSECETPIATLIDLCLEFKVKLDARKREKKLIDFGDMEHFALNILLDKNGGEPRPTKTALEYRDFFTEILIDEYQDSNLVQEYLLEAVSCQDKGHYNRFMVGDVKQSIYKFRLARPELFLEKYLNYSVESAQTDTDMTDTTQETATQTDISSNIEQGCARIDLHHNFRSRREVVDTVNGIFEHIMGEELGGIVYDEAAALHAGAVYPDNSGCESELILFQKPDKSDDIGAKELEALGIARRIKELRGSFLVTDKRTGELRPLEYRDIVILLRTNSGWDEEFKRVFDAEGIPAYIASKTGYFGTLEIQTVTQFLKVLDNPLQDIPLFGSMKSVFGGFTEEEIAWIKVALRDTKESAGDTKESTRGDKRLYDGLRIVAKQEEENLTTELASKCQTFLSLLERYRDYAVYMPMRKLLQTLFDEFSYLPYVAALPAGSQRLANAEMLLTKASDYEKSSYYGLFHFIRYMEQLVKYEVDYGEAGTLDENADVVRLMSIHKSKGLEFPVTFVAGLSKNFNMQDVNASMIVDIDMGIGTDYVNPDKRIKSKNLRKKALAAKMRMDNLAEEIRVLYVALTRPKEKLIMTGIIDNVEDIPADRVEGLIPYSELCQASSYMDLILPTFPVTNICYAEDMVKKELEEVMDTGVRIGQLKEAKSYANLERLNQLKKQFDYHYPHQALSTLYTKTTVSELKKAAMEELPGESRPLFETEEIVPYIPTFARDKEEVSGTTRGSAVHKVMECMDFVKIVPQKEERLCQSIELLMDQLEETGKLTAEYHQAVRADKIAHFMTSSLANRMYQAELMGKLYREQPFVYGIEADRLSPEYPKTETMLIQGIVDVFFEEEDGCLVLADYKTDVIKTPIELVDRYHVQLDYYAEALERLLGKPVKERILYSFYLGEEIKC